MQIFIIRSRRKQYIQRLACNPAHLLVSCAMHNKILMGRTICFDYILGWVFLFVGLFISIFILLYNRSSRSCFSVERVWFTPKYEPIHFTAGETDKKIHSFIYLNMYAFDTSDKVFFVHISILIKVETSIL